MATEVPLFIVAVPIMILVGAITGFIAKVALNKLDPIVKKAILNYSIKRARRNGMNETNIQKLQDTAEQYDA